MKEINENYGWTAENGRAVEQWFNTPRHSSFTDPSP
jgi:hypothetical protein